jgi:predicted AlkP superfamily phosphohydrolase/phosphomutase
MSRKVLMIGLDAASLDFIRSSLPSLPTLRRAIDTGVVRRLRSRTSELLPAAVWPTLYTGSPPGAHGVYYHLQWDPAAMRLRQISDWYYCEPFWYELERLGHRVVAFDVPMSWPSRLSHGLEITDWGTHDRMTSFRASSADLARDIRRRFGSYPTGPEIPVRKTWSQLARMRDDIIRGVRRRAEAARWLLGLRDWDFGVVVFSETHRAGHLFWPSADAEGLAHPRGSLLAVYQAVDAAIGEILGGLAREETTVIIFAAHGMGRNTSQEHFTRPIMDRVNRRFPGLTGRAPAEEGPRQRSVMRVLRERLPARLQHAIGERVPAAVRDFVVDRAITAGHDWTHTPALAVLASVSGYVRLNLRGRERLGMLDPDGEEYTRYVKWMRESFESFRIAETGEPLVKELTFTRDVFPGARQGALPDAVVSWTGAPTVSRIESPSLGVIDAELPTGRAGNHHPEGFSIVIDPGGGHGDVGESGAGDVMDLKPMVFRRLLGAAAGNPHPRST